MNLILLAASCGLGLVGSETGLDAGRAIADELNAAAIILKPSG